MLQAKNKTTTIITVASLAVYVIAADNTIVNIALPSIAEDLHAGPVDLAWVVDAYIITLAAGLLFAGAVGDRLGRVRTLAAGMLILAAGSALSAAAGNVSTLIAGRAVTGIGAAFAMPATLALITVNTQAGKQRQGAIAIWSAAIAGGIATGPLAGGILTEHYSWEGVFIANAVAGLLVAVVVKTLLRQKEQKHQTGSRFDWLGAFLSIVAGGTLTFSIIEIQHRSLTSAYILVPFVVAIVAGALFVKVELSSAHALLDLNLFKNPSFTAASIAETLVNFALIGCLFFVTLYFQYVEQYTPLQAGMRTLPIAVAVIVGSLLAPMLVRKVGIRLAVVYGELLTVCGLLYGATVAGDGYSSLIPTLVAAGIGLGLALTPATDSIMGAVSYEQATTGSAVNDVTRELGGAMGVAVLGSITASVYKTRSGTSDIIQDTHTAGRLGEAEAQKLLETSHAAFTHAMSVTLMVAGIVAAVGVFVAFKWLPDDRRNPTVN